MTDPYSELQGASVLDPSNVLVGLGAVAAIVAARCWFKVFRSIDTGGQTVTGPNNYDLRNAAFATSLALGLASVGYLFGQFLGHV